MKKETKEKDVDATRKYNMLHYRLRKKYGKATKCEFIETCSKISKTYEWALKKGREYSDDPEDYYQLCKSCHSKYDYKGGQVWSDQRRENFIRKKKGLPAKNKGIDSRKMKNCLQCNNEYLSYPSKNRKYCSPKCRAKHLDNLRPHKSSHQKSQRNLQ